MASRQAGLTLRRTVFEGVDDIAGTALIVSKDLYTRRPGWRVASGHRDGDRWLRQHRLHDRTFPCRRDLLEVIAALHAADPIPAYGPPTATLRPAGPGLHRTGDGRFEVRAIPGPSRAGTRDSWTIISLDTDKPRDPYTVASLRHATRIIGHWQCPADSSR